MRTNKRRRSTRWTKWTKWATGFFLGLAVLTSQLPVVQNLLDRFRPQPQAALVAERQDRKPSPLGATNRQPLEDDDDDVFQDRINDPGRVDRIISALARHYGVAPEDAAFRQLARFLRDLYQEIARSLTDPAKLAPMIAEVYVVGQAGFLLGLMNKRLRERFIEPQLQSAPATPPNPYATDLSAKAQRLHDYFQFVPKSRVAEVAAGTGLGTKEAGLLLELLPFTHERGCFWRPVTVVASQTETSKDTPGITASIRNLTVQ